MAGRGKFDIRVAMGLACVLAATAGVSAAPYDFVPAPQTDLNRVYRIDRITGEVSSCQYGLQEGTVGVTLCFGGGEGAGAQPPGEYGLVLRPVSKGKKFSGGDVARAQGDGLMFDAIWTFQISEEAQ